MMGHTIFGRYIPVALAVILFVAANFLLIETGWPQRDQAILRNLLPAGIGNLIGGMLLVALPSGMQSILWQRRTSPDRPGSHE